MLHTIVFDGLVAVAIAAWIQIFRDIRLELVGR